MQVFENVARTLRASLTRDDSDVPQGWPHDLRELGARATAASTAYGLRAMLLLEGSLAPDLLPVANRLKERAGPGGGYAAQTQRAATARGDRGGPGDAAADRRDCSPG